MSLHCEQCANCFISHRAALLKAEVALCEWSFQLKGCPHLQKGQLGHGDLLQRNVPTVVEGLSKHEVIGGMPNFPALKDNCEAAFLAVGFRSCLPASN